MRSLNRCGYTFVRETKSKQIGRDKYLEQTEIMRIQTPDQSVICVPTLEKCLAHIIMLRAHIWFINIPHPLEKNLA